MNKLILILAAVSLFYFSCSRTSQDKVYSVDITVESAQQIGDAMVSVDEFGGTTTGAITKSDAAGYEKAFARLSHDEPVLKSSALKLFLPEAQAATCSTYGFSVCSATFQESRNLTGCTTVAGGTMSGNITLTFAGTGAATCTIPAVSDSITRVPSYDVSGLRGAVFGVSAVSTGQTLTRTGASTFDYSSTGIRRSFTNPDAVTILDITTSTSAPISISGSARDTRTMSGGGLTVVNNLTGVSCALAPAGVTWTANCNCPTSGTWSGTCSDATNFSVAFTGTCGETTVTKGSDVSTVVMDRCE